MAFFNPKEDVIDIEITQYGKYLLSKGKFKPTYYQFFDDDILYDISYIPTSTELQNSTEPRIQEETPRLRPQHIYTGVESTMKKTQMGQAPVQPTIEKQYALSAPLGTSEVRSDYAPGLTAHFWSGLISSSSDHLEMNYKSPIGTLNTKYLDIPQINTKITYNLKAMTKADKTSGWKAFLDEEKIYEEGDEYKTSDMTPDKDVTVVDFPDGTFLQVEHDHILVELGESNSPFLRDNFDVEVFEIEEIYDSGSVKTGEQRLKSLYFASKYPEYNDELLLDDNQMSYSVANFSNLDSNYVEYFFEVEVDEEIDTEVFCRHRQVDQSKGLFVDRTFDCPDVAAVTQESIYGPPDNETGDICED